MEKGKHNEESEILKALESIHLENQNLQHCLKQVVVTRRLLEAKWDTVTSQLSSIEQENCNLQDENFILSGKIEAVEKEANGLDETKKNLVDVIEKLNAEIKEYKEGFDTKIDNFVVATDKLSTCFLLAVTNDEKVEEECLLKLEKDFDKMKEEIVEKENNIAKMKEELEESDFYDFPEDPIELDVGNEERQFIMNMMESNLRTARQQLEDLYKLKAEKEKEESEL